MTLTLAEVNHIAELARLALTDEEKERYREQLSAILDYAAAYRNWTPPASRRPPLCCADDTLAR